MKRFISGVILALLALSMLTSAFRVLPAISSAATNSVAVLKPEEKQVTVLFPIPTATRIGAYYWLRIENCSYLTSPGEPMLPTKSARAYFSIEPVAVAPLTDINSSINGLETPSTPSPIGQDFTVQIHLRNATALNVPAGLGAVEVHFYFGNILNYCKPIGFTDMIGQPGGVLLGPSSSLLYAIRAGFYDDAGNQISASPYTNATQYIVAVASTAGGWNNADGLVAEITFQITGQPSSPQPDFYAPLQITYRDLVDESANSVPSSVVQGTVHIDAAVLALGSPVYEEEATSKPQSGGSWSAVNDPSSWSGIVMKASSTSANGGCLFGPYITSDWYGDSMLGKPYTATFRLKVSSNVSSDVVVYVDVGYDAGYTLQSGMIKASDFASANVWQDFQLSFITPRSLTAGLEFRVINLNNGVTDISVDEISVARDVSIVYLESANNKPQSGGSWSAVNDPSSWSGIVMKASSTSANGGCLFGPYITSDWYGDSMLGKPYTATFRLKVSSNVPASNMIDIDVGYNSGRVLQSVLIKANDFMSANTWQDFKLTFIAPVSLTYGLEFRAINVNNGVADVYVDRITVDQGWNADTTYLESAYNKFQSGNSWSATSDPSSFSGLVMKASSALPNGGCLFGPYTSVGWDQESMLGRAYVATFRLKVSSNLAASDVVSIDVACNAGTVLQSLRIKATDFFASNVWQDFKLTFVVPSSLSYGLEFRITNLNHDTTDVFADCISITQS